MNNIERFMHKYNMLKRIGASIENISVYILCLDVHCEIEIKRLNKLYPIPLYNQLEFYDRKYYEIKFKVKVDTNFKINIIDCNWYNSDFDDSKIILWETNKSEDGIDCKLTNMD